MVIYVIIGLVWINNNADMWKMIEEANPQPSGRIVTGFVLVIIWAPLCIAQSIYAALHNQGNNGE
jgi:hypothetical protein